MIIKICSVLIYLVLNTVGLTLIKQYFVYRDSMDLIGVTSFFDWRLILGALLYIASFLTWMIIISKDDLSVMYPIVVGLGYVAIMIAAYFVLNEKAGIFKLVGTALILAGIIAILMERKG